MHQSSRRLLLAAALCATLLSAVLTAAALASVHFQKESVQAYERQLKRGEVHADSLHPGTGTSEGHLHVSLNDGRHMTVSYTTSEQAKLIAQARAKGARVVVAHPKPKARKATKHKLRYIAGGILIIVILIVLAVLLIGRRRSIMEQAQPTGAAGAGDPQGASTDAE